MHWIVVFNIWNSNIQPDWEKNWIFLPNRTAVATLASCNKNAIRYVAIVISDFMSQLTTTSLSFSFFLSTVASRKIQSQWREKGEFCMLLDVLHQYVLNNSAYYSNISFGKRIRCSYSDVSQFPHFFAVTKSQLDSLLLLLAIIWINSPSLL